MTITHVLSVSLVPADAMMALKMLTILDEVCARNPSFGVSVGPVNEIVLHGVGELRLEMMVDLLKRHHGLDIQVGAPQVRYSTSIARTIEWDYTYKKQTGGIGQYAKVKIRFEPAEPGIGIVFENAAEDGAVPARFVPGVEKGLHVEKEQGIVAALPVDLKCTLLDGGYHDVDSSEHSFELAARWCFREATAKAGSRILEPIMYVVVLTPPEHMGDVVGDLNSRRGVLQGMETRGEMTELTALVPFANLFGYQNTLSSITRGGAQHMMAFVRYEQIPPYRGPDDDNFSPAIGMRT
jgi:elongation factor G